MQTSSSAKRTCNEFSSASEYTATVLMPSSRQAWMTRRAISPRFAIRIFLNMRWSPLSGGLDREQALAVLDRLAVLHVHLDDFPVAFGVDLVHELHRLDDAQHLALANLLPDVRKRLGPRF